MAQMEMIGSVGTYVDSNNLISFQLGNKAEDVWGDVWKSRAVANGQTWQRIGNFNIASRGANNHSVEDVEADLRGNRLLPQLLRKQVSMLYGQGLALYQRQATQAGWAKIWVDVPEVTAWLESWEDRGLENNYKAVARGVIKNFYWFRDFFVKWRFTAGSRANLNTMPIAGFELLENRRCRLATTNTDVSTRLPNYKELRYVVVGDWGTNFGQSSFQSYPRVHLSSLNKIRFAGVSHHREKAIGEFYGLNETHEGTQHYIKAANKTPRYINSFLENSLAAKVHIIIPNAWIESRRMQITNLCKENDQRQKNKEELLTLDGLEIGTEYKESTLMRYIQNELRKISTYLAGTDNQGKAYASISFKSGSNAEERWQIETVDLKYKEYISALIDYDKRADEVLLSAVGMDSSISSVSKDGVISKSGADAYYNYLIYIMGLTPDEDVCAEPFNMALKVNFPSLYNQGYRFGFYRITPARQEDTSSSDRLKNQQS